MPYKYNPFTGNFDRVGPGSGSLIVETLTGNSGGAVGPDASFNIDILGAGKYSFTGNPGTNTLTLDDDGSVADEYITDSGTAVPSAGIIRILGDAVQGSVTSGASDTVTITLSDATTSQKGVSELATDAEAIAGSATNVTIVPSSLAAKLGDQTTNALAYGQGTSSPLAWTSALTDGEVVIGCSTGPPEAAQLTGGTGINVVSGCNSITINSSGSTPLSFLTDNGGVAVPVAHMLTIAGGTLLNTAGVGSTVTVNADDNVVGGVDSDSGSAVPTSNAFTIAGGTGIDTSGAGATITISVDGSTVGQTITGDAGGALSPTAGNWNILGGTGLSTSGAVSTLTINLDGSVVGQTITGDTGGALSPTAGNWNIVGTSTNGIQTDGSGSTLTPRFNSPYADGDFSFESQSSGATRTFTVQNTVDAASSSAVLQVGVAGTSSGDPFYRSFIGSTKSYAWGQSNSDNFWRLTTDSSASADLADTLLLTFDEGIVGDYRALFGIPNMALAYAPVSADVDLTVLNSDNTMTDSNSRINIQVGGDSGGDPYLTFTGGTWSSWSIGVANASSDELVTFQQNAPSTTSIITQQTTVAGEVTFPLQPAFLALHNITQTNITGAGTTATINFTTEIFDQNSDYDGTNTFTAPVTGKYQFNANVYTHDYVAATSFELRITTSNRTFRSDFLAPLTVAVLGTGLVQNLSVFTDMDAADTAVVQVIVSGEAGDIIDSNASGTTGQFSGFLAC